MSDYFYKITSNVTQVDGIFIDKFIAIYAKSNSQLESNDAIAEVQKLMNTNTNNSISWEGTRMDEITEEEYKKQRQ